MNLYVGNLDYTIKDQQLAAMFGEFGEVSTVKIITDKITGKSKGFAFVEMPNDDEGREAITNLNQKEVKDRPISVSEARPPQPNERRSFTPNRDNNRFKRR